MAINKHPCGCKNNHSNSVLNIYTGFCVERLTVLTGYDPNIRLLYAFALQGFVNVNTSLCSVAGIQGDRLVGYSSVLETVPWRSTCSLEDFPLLAILVHSFNTAKGHLPAPLLYIDNILCAPINQLDVRSVDTVGCSVDIVASSTSNDKL